MGNRNLIMINFRKQNNNGFTILFAVLVSTLILTIGASVINIALKQLTLSGSARDSQFAFYAANTGIECALYWDFVGVDGVSIPVFATSSDTVSAIQSNISDIHSSVKCSEKFIIDGDNLSNVEHDCDIDIFNDTGWCIDDSSTDSATTSFRIDPIADGVEYCVDVNVSKYLDGDGRTRTAIDSRGYNTCDGDDNRRVERGLRITF